MHPSIKSRIIKDWIESNWLEYLTAFRNNEPMGKWITEKIGIEIVDKTAIKYLEYCNYKYHEHRKLIGKEIPMLKDDSDSTFNASYKDFYTLEDGPLTVGEYFRRNNRNALYESFFKRK